MLEIQKKENVRKRNKEIDTFEEPKKDTNTKIIIEENYISFFHNPKNFFQIALLLRILSVFMTKTFFVPDEYWQSTEVAHRQVFGYGYLTWEWRKQIRSYFYPFIFELYFQILKLFAIDFYLPTLVRYGPHVIQAVLTSLNDVCVYKLSLKITNSVETARYSYFLYLSSWFVFYIGSRTLSNVSEMCFSTIGLSFFSFSMNTDVKSLALAIFFGGIGCIIRPTCFLIWVPLILCSLFKKDIHIFCLLKACCMVVPVFLALLFGIDFYFYSYEDKCTNIR